MGRFKSLVESEEGIESFRALYRIPPRVGIRYFREGHWHEDRQEGEVVILITAFIEGGMKIPMGRITRDYLRAHRLASAHNIRECRHPKRKNGLRANLP